MAGWVKLHRELTEKAIWKCSSPEQKVILITLLMLADHKESEWLWQGKKFKTQPGQFVTSVESIMKTSGVGISRQNVRSAIVKFENLGFLTNESTKTGRLITIVNWGVYQSQNGDTNIDTNKELTKHQHSTNIALTPNKNVRTKELKNQENKDIYIKCQSLSMTEEEYDKLIGLYGKDRVDAKLEYAENYAPLAKKYKSLYKTLNNWLKNDNQKKEPEIPRAYRSIMEVLK